MHGRRTVNILFRLPGSSKQYLSRRYKSDEPSATPPSALHDRFTSLLESNIDSSSMSSIRNNPDITKILDKYSQDSAGITFNNDYQSEISYLKSEDLLARNKHAREIADTVSTPAWNGTETVRDANLRMIIDTAPKKLSQRRIITPPTPIRERIHNAKEESLDYRLSRISQDGGGDKAKSNNTEDEKFKELYKERLLGPMMFMNSMSSSSGIGLITSMADVRINEQIDRKTGKFEGHENMDSVRGKPLSKEHLANCTDTNYFMNQILQKEECLPPWIESQKGVNGDIERLRFDLDKSWSIKAVEILDKKYAYLSKEELVQVVRTKYQNSSSETLFDSDYHNFKVRFLQPSIKDINMKITTYNLSSPSPNFHKWKLVLEDELKASYSRVLSNLDIVLQQRNERERAVLMNKASIESEAPSFGFIKAVKSLVLRK
ncbi:hypothetical protein CLIB1423_10S02212 [[Candida] railenensis]|uniref:DnaJ homologue subfamily C member 28 conserved domain-containing protein n=1 Tax=[Candida] railenensis TaxID=45579 RepID=A0A9P0QR03_9ASCO|nr:hypothetical protein CLIB1423_10S02212 [[Candida] railenensis]